jgi:hypothetical protein
MGKCGPIAAGLAVFLTTSSVLAADQCAFLLSKYSLAERNLVNLGSIGSNAIVPQNGYEFKQRLNSLSLGYVVPVTRYPTGVLIVKSRHTVLTTNSAPVGGNNIRVERRRYISPCSGKKIGPYGDDVRPERYIDYHFYGLDDSERDPARNLENAHADVGVRQFSQYWSLPARTGCLNTRYSTIRAQFLYDDRRAAFTYETLGRQINLFSEATGTSPTYAAPSAYRQYESLNTQVIPYQRTPNKPACFAFVVPIPANAVQTQVMIVDADDAFANSGIDPQKTWQFTWPAPILRSVASTPRY